ncbi:MAG: hypothetical protein N2487_02340 [Verrucomicrobiae bacterium]|nr:hypothetical protein [Verrucomicrobiae bacterium]
MDNSENRRLRIPMRFEGDVRFNLAPVAVVPYRGMLDNELERLKNALVRDALERSEPELYSTIRRAANDAMALAWATPYPALFFPLLFEEKIAEGKKVYSKQRKIKEKTRRLLIHTV